MKGVYIDTAQLAKSASALQRALQGRIPEAAAEVRHSVTETAVETAHALAARTFPAAFGFALAKGRLTHELRLIYATAGNVFDSMLFAGERPLATKFYAAYKSQDYAEARRILQKTRTHWRSVPIGPLDPSLHERFRNPSNGHIEVERPQQIVTAEDLKAYTAIAIQRLGKTASGWMACAEQLGGDGNKPKWKGTAMHGPDGGFAEVNQTPTGYVIRMFNTRKLARKHLSPGQLKRIQRQAQRRLAERLVTGGVMRKLGRKAS